MKRNEAQTLKAVSNAMVEIKRMTSVAQPVKIAVTKIADQYKINPYVIPTLIKMDILGFEQENNTKKYIWKYGSGEVDDALVAKVYEKACSQQAQVKKNSVERIKAKEATKQTEVKAPVVKHVSKVKHNQTKQVKQVKVTEAPVTTPNEPTTLLKAEKDLGVVFGYKQLQYHDFEAMQLPTDVHINSMIIPNVMSVKYVVDGSKLTITLHNTDQRRDANEYDGTVLAKMVVENQVIGLKRMGGDSKMLMLRITLIPVKDPYKLLV